MTNTEWFLALLAWTVASITVGFIWRGIADLRHWTDKEKQAYNQGQASVWAACAAALQKEMAKLNINTNINSAPIWRGRHAQLTGEIQRIREPIK